jgi:hypothetical protein
MQEMVSGKKKVEVVLPAMKVKKPFDIWKMFKTRVIMGKKDEV